MLGGKPLKKIRRFAVFEYGDFLAALPSVRCVRIGRTWMRAGDFRSAVQDVPSSLEHDFKLIGIINIVRQCRLLWCEAAKPGHLVCEARCRILVASPNCLHEGVQYF